MALIELVSSYSPEECAARLEVATSRDGLLDSFYHSQPVVGKVSSRSVRLRKRVGPRNSFRNRNRTPFQTFFIGTLEEYEGGTLLRASTGMHPVEWVATAVWVCGVAAVGGVSLLAGVVGVITGMAPPAAVVIPVLVLTLGLGVVWLGRWAVRNEESFLIDYVKSVIDARHIGP